MDLSGSPVPGEQVGELALRYFGDAAEHIGKPGLGIDIVELCGGDQAEHERSALAAAI